MISVGNCGQTEIVEVLGRYFYVPDICPLCGANLIEVSWEYDDVTGKHLLISCPSCGRFIAVEPLMVVERGCDSWSLPNALSRVKKQIQKEYPGYEILSIRKINQYWRCYGILHYHFQVFLLKEQSHPKPPQNTVNTPCGAVWGVRGEPCPTRVKAEAPRLRQRRRWVLRHLPSEVAGEEGSER